MYVLTCIISNHTNRKSAQIEVIFYPYRVKLVLKATELQEYQQRKCKNIKKLQRLRWPIEINADSDDRRYIMSHMPLCLLPPDTLDIAKVVYVARNPLDVAVSMFHLNRSLQSYKFVGDFRTFWRLFYKDLSK